MNVLQKLGLGSADKARDHILSDLAALRTGQAQAEAARRAAIEAVRLEVEALDEPRRRLARLLGEDRDARRQEDAAVSQLEATLHARPEPRPVARVRAMLEHAMRELAEHPVKLREAHPAAARWHIKTGAYGEPLDFAVLGAERHTRVMHAIENARRWWLSESGTLPSAELERQAGEWITKIEEALA